MKDLTLLENKKTVKIIETFLSDIDNLDYDVRNTPISELDTNKFIKKQEAGYRFNKIINHCIDKIVDNLGREKFFEIVSAICPNEEVNKTKEEILESAKDHFLEDKEIKDEASLSLEEREQKYLELLEKKDLNSFKELKHRKYVFLFRESIKKDKNIVSSLVENVEKNGLKVDDLFSEEVLVPTDEGFISDKHPKEEKIKDMIKGLDPANDKELIEALSYANEVIIEGDGNARQFTSDVAEGYADITSNIRSYTAKKDIEERVSDSSFLVGNEKFISVKLDREGDANAVKFSNALKEIDKSNLKASFDQNVAKQLLEIVKECEDAGIFSMDSLSAGESGKKIYSFHSLVAKRYELEQAVEEKNFDKIKTLSKEYKTLDDKYMTVINKLKALGVPGEIPSNISSSRQSNVPQKYVNDYIGASRLSNLWNIYGMVKRYNLSMEEALADPLRATKMMYEKSIHGDTETDHFLKTASNNEVIRGFLYDENLFQDAKLSDGIIDGICLRGLSNLVFYLPDSQQKRDYQARMDLETQIITSNSGFRVRGQTVSYNGEELLSNVLIAEPTDRNLFDMSGKPGLIDINTHEIRKPFDSAEYIKSGKTSVDNILNRCGDLLSEFVSCQSRRNLAADLIKVYNRSAAGLEMLVDKIAKSGIKCTKEQKEMFDQLYDVKNYSPLENRMLAAKLQAMNYSKLKDNTILSCESGLYNLAKLRAEWKGRNLFLKMFGPETRRLSREIESMKTMYNKMGFSKKVIDDETARYNSKKVVKLECEKNEDEYRKMRMRSESPYTKKTPEPNKDLEAYAKAGLIPPLDNSTRKAVIIEENIITTSTNKETKITTSKEEIIANNDKTNEINNEFEDVNVL